MMKNTRLLQTFLLAFTVLLPDVLFAQQPGDLDITFSTDGKVTTGIGTGDDEAYSAVIQPDGKIILAGSSYTGYYEYFALARYNADGTLDNSFSTDGKLTTGIGNAQKCYVNAVALQSDGKIVAVGHVDNATGDFAIVRYKTNGSLDNSFSTDGKVITDFGGDDYATSVAIQPDGKIVVAGYSGIASNYDISLCRYNSNGSLDSTFGTNGKRSMDIDNRDDYAWSVLLVADGKIITGGYSEESNTADFSLLRFNGDGSLDSSFGIEGKVITDFLGDDEAYSLALQPDGKIIAAGSANINFQLRLALARYNLDGSVDSSFGTYGRQTKYVYNDVTFGNSVAVDSDGEIFVAGTIDDVFYDWFLAKYKPNGTLDSSFSSDGLLKGPFGWNVTYGYAVAIQPDGKIVVAGSSENTNIDQDFAVARYISTLNIGVIDLGVNNESTLIYPNPIEQNASLEYTLKNQGTISIQMLDMLGRVVKVFLEKEHQNEGYHQQQLNFPSQIPSGSYFIEVSSNTGAKVSIKIIK